MNSRRYWKNRLPFLLTNLVCMAALTVFLLVCGNSVSAVLLILIVWALILLAGLVLTYWKRKRQMKKLLDMAEQLSERYLISEVMELPEQAEDQVYYQLLKMAGKSMLEQIGEVERERLEYKEYIEQWIHEIKTPIKAQAIEDSPGDTDSFEPGAAFIHRPSGTGEVHEQQGYRSSDDGGDSGDGKDLGVYILHDLFGLGPYICCRISRLTEHHGHHHTQEGAVSHFGQRKPALGLGIRLLKLRSLRGFRFLQFAILQF